MKAGSPSSRYVRWPAMVLLIPLLATAGACSAGEPAPPPTAAAASPTAGGATKTTPEIAPPAPETTLGEQPAGRSATVATLVPTLTEPSSVATTTQAPAATTTAATTAGSTAPSTTAPTTADGGGTTTTEVLSVTGESTTTTTEPPTTTTTEAPTTTTTRAPTTTQAPTTTAPAVDGSAVYSLNCAVCHNASGEGGTGADLQQSALSLAEITSVIVDGRGKLMPAWGDILTAAEIEAVARYVEALQKG